MFPKGVPPEHWLWRIKAVDISTLCLADLGGHDSETKRVETRRANSGAEQELLTRQCDSGQAEGGLVAAVQWVAVPLEENITVLGSIPCHGLYLLIIFLNLLYSTFYQTIRLLIIRKWDIKVDQSSVLIHSWETLHLPIWDYYKTWAIWCLIAVVRKEIPGGHGYLSWL